MFAMMTLPLCPHDYHEEENGFGSCIGTSDACWVYWHKIIFATEIWMNVLMGHLIELVRY